MMAFSNIFNFQENIKFKLYLDFYLNYFYIEMEVQEQNWVKL